MKNIRLVISLNAALIFISSLAFSSEILIPAAQVGKGRVLTAVCYSTLESKLTLQIKNADEIKVNGLSYISEAANDFECSFKGNAVTAKAVFNPNDELYYWIKTGAGSYELEIPSETVKNRLSTVSPGWIAGCGARIRLFPETIVSSAVSLEFGISYSAYSLESFKSGGSAPEAVSDRISLTELQMAVLFSRKLGKFEPYGGLKVFRNYTKIYDKISASSIKGTDDKAGIVAGTKVLVFSKEALVVEGSFLGETAASLGWSVEF